MQHQVRREYDETPQSHWQATAAQAIASVNEAHEAALERIRKRDRNPAGEGDNRAATAYAPLSPCGRFRSWREASVCYEGAVALPKSPAAHVQLDDRLQNARANQIAWASVPCPRCKWCWC